MSALRITAASDYFLLYTGYGREEVIGKTSLELGMTRDVVRRESAFAEIARNGGAKDFMGQSCSLLWVSVKL